MITLITFDAGSGAYHQTTVNKSLEEARALLPRDVVLMFVIEDDIDVLTVDGDSVEELVL